MAPGFFARLFGKASGEAPAAPRAARPAAAPAASTAVPILRSWTEDVEVSGESYRRAELARVFGQLGRPEGGVTMQIAVLVPEPRNPHDSNAVKVIILGEHVGYVPAELSARVAKQCRSLPRGSTATVLARVWAKNDDGVWRGRVTLAFSGDAERERDYAAERREAEQHEAARYAEQERRRAERARKDADKAARKSAGSVRGEYWPNLKPLIAELKRQGQLVEARALLEECVVAAEREAVAIGGLPHPWPTEQCAAVMRRLKDNAAELAVLERFVALLGDAEVPDGVRSKLARARVTARPE